MVVVLPIAAIVVALLAVLCYYALKQSITLLVQALPDIHIPTVGSLRSLVASGFSSVESYARNTFAGPLGALTKFVTQPITVARNFLDQIEATIGSAYNTVNWVISYAIPHAVSSFAAHVVTLINEAKAYALQVAHDLHTTVEFELNSVRSFLLAAIADARAYALSVAHDLHVAVDFELNAVRTSLSDGINAVRSEAINAVNHLYNVLHLEISQTVGQALTTAEHYAGALVTDLENEAKIAVAAVLPGIESAVAGVIDTAGDGFSDVTGLLKELDWTKITTIAGSTAGALTIARAMLKLAEDCTIPNCRNLSGFGNDLQALLGLVADGALLAFLADAAHDPAGTAREVQDTIGTVYRDTAGLFAGLVGV